MQIVAESTVMINPATGAIDEQLDALMDATDQAYAWGHEDATSGTDNQASYYYIANTPAWNAYNDGYRTGAIVAAILTGTTRKYWDPAQPHEIQCVSWASGPTMGLAKCSICGNYYDPTYGSCPTCYSDQQAGKRFVGAPADWPTVEDVSALEARADDERQSAARLGVARVVAAVIDANREARATGMTWEEVDAYYASDYVPFQMAKESYADVLSAEDREDWVGL